MIVGERVLRSIRRERFRSERIPRLRCVLARLVSIARRLQDPLAELVKIDPKSIGVGQYQHDVTSSKCRARSTGGRRLRERGRRRSEHRFGAAAGLRVGHRDGLAENIVAYRDANGRIRDRRRYRKCRGSGRAPLSNAPASCASRGDDPLDASVVHPEAYPAGR